jgi:hypothetical protein
MALTSKEIDVLVAPTDPVGRIKQRIKEQESTSLHISGHTQQDIAH